MPVLRTLIAFLLLNTLATAAELRTLSGKTMTGEPVGADEQQLIFRTESGNVPVPFAEILQVELIKQNELKPLPKETFIDVELSDGSLLHCRSVELKVAAVAVELLAGPKVRFPLSAVSWILNQAEDSTVQKEWQDILTKRGNRDLLAIRAGENINKLEGTLGEADDKGETIEFELSSGRKVRPNLHRILGMAFVRRAGGAAPICRVTDITQSTVAAGKLSFTETTATITSAAGVTIAYPRSSLSFLDFSRGKLTFLSDLTPLEVKESPNSDTFGYHYRRDKNLENGRLTLGKQSYDKGLALFAGTDLTYDVDGYQKFEAVAGIDTLVGVDGNVRLTINGDGRELLTITIKRADALKPISVDLRGVKKLRIAVRSVDLLDLGNHLDLAEARVSK